MPYITKEERKTLEISDNLEPGNPGALNYCLTQVVLSYLGPQPRYRTFADAIGALECCKLELYRRIVAPYEDTKIKENGDVY